MEASKTTTSVKLVLLGEAAVGKSSLVLRFVSDEFQENKEPTIGAAFLTQKCQLSNRTVKFEIWDTAGQERFASLAPMYYRNAQAAVVVYDVTKPPTFIRARHWVNELKTQGSPNIIIALVANKHDLTGEDEEGEAGPVKPDVEDETGSSIVGRKVAYSDGQKLAEDEGLLFFEASAKTGMNVRKIFLAIANKIPIENKTPNQSNRASANETVDVGMNSSQAANCQC